MTGVYLLRPDGLRLETAYCKYQGSCDWQVSIYSLHKLCCEDLWLVESS